VDEPVEDRVGQRGITDGSMPVIDRKLAGHDGRARAMTVVEHLQQIAAVHVVEDSESPVVDHEHINPCQLLEQLAIAAVGAVQIADSAVMLAPSKN